MHVGDVLIGLGADTFVIRRAIVEQRAAGMPFEGAASAERRAHAELFVLVPIARCLHLLAAGWPAVGKIRHPTERHVTQRFMSTQLQAHRMRRQVAAAWLVFESHRCGARDRGLQQSAVVRSHVPVADRCVGPSCGDAQVVRERVAYVGSLDIGGAVAVVFRLEHNFAQERDAFRDARGQ